MKYIGTEWNEKIPKRQLKTSLRTQLEDINQKILVKEGDSKGTEIGSSNINKTEHFKMTKENWWQGHKDASTTWYKRNITILE